MKENTITKLEREIKDLENQIKFSKEKEHNSIMNFKTQVLLNDTPEYYMGNDFYKLHTDMQSACRWVEVLEGNLEVKKQLKKDILEEIEKEKEKQKEEKQTETDMRWLIEIKKHLIVNGSIEQYDDENAFIISWNDRTDTFSLMMNGKVIKTGKKLFTIFSKLSEKTVGTLTNAE